MGCIEQSLLENRDVTKNSKQANDTQEKGSVRLKKEN